jgi:hypothetical protein
VDLSGLSAWRRRRVAAEVADPQVVVFRYSEVLRGQLIFYGVAVLIGVAAMATAAVPHRIMLAEIYAVVNSGYAFKYTRRDLRRVRAAGDFAAGISVRVSEPGVAWDVYGLIAALFIGGAYFYGAAISGRYLVAFFAPDLVQAVITGRAVARRERAGLDLYIHGGRVDAHLRSLPLDQRQPVATLRPGSSESLFDRA